MHKLNPDGTPVGYGSDYITGIIISIAPSAPYYDIEVSRATSTASYDPQSYNDGITPESFNWRTVDIINQQDITMAGTVYVDEVPAVSGSYYWYRFRSIGLTVTASAWTYGDVRQGAQPHTFSRAQLAGITKTRSAFASTTIDMNGKYLTPDVRQSDTVTNQILTKNTLWGEASHSQYIEFSPPFQNMPIVHIEGGISYQPASVWSPHITGVLDPAVANRAPNAGKPQYFLTKQEAVSSTGVTIRALLYQPPSSSITTHSQSFVANALTLNSASIAVNGNYHTNYEVDVNYQTKSGGPWSVTTTVAIDTNNGSGWVERATDVVNEPLEGPGTFIYTPIVGSIDFSDSSLVNGDGVRIRLKSVEYSGLFYYTNTEHLTGGPLYYSIAPAGGALYTTQTYDTGSTVRWTAVGYI